MGHQHRQPPLRIRTALLEGSGREDSEPEIELDPSTMLFHSDVDPADKLHEGSDSDGKSRHSAESDNDEDDSDL